MWGEIGYKKYPFDIDALRKGIEDGYEKSRRVDPIRKKTFAPSNINPKYQGNCGSYWYQVMSEDVPQNDRTSARSFAIMQNGTKFHDRLGEAFDASDLDVELEREFTLDDPGIHGFIDVLWTVDGEIIVGELKSCRSEAFVVKKARMNPNEEHLIQLLIYLKAMGAKKGFLLYENKNEQQSIVIPVEMTPENEKYIEYVFEWLRGITKRIEAKEPITRPWSKPTAICKACPIMMACWSDETYDPKSNYPTLAKHLKGFVK